MDADGGMSKYSGNKAGAKYGTGYCDSHCPRNVKFINGEASFMNITRSTYDPASAHGSYGACCNEMDIWEANNKGAVYTAHPCNPGGPTRCEGTACGGDDRYATVCDPDGCDFNSYRMGNTSFYGQGKTVDTTKKFTVVTQFITDDGTSSGNLKEIRRLYVQNGVVIQNSKVNIPGLDPTMDSITDKFCDAQKAVFGDPNQFKEKGGLRGLGDGMKSGMVLVLSIEDDHATDMAWLDSTFPKDADPYAPGVSRGNCNNYGEAWPQLEVIDNLSYVTFSNIKFGDIGSTYGTDSSPTRQAFMDAPCFSCSGGNGYTGPTQCATGSSCQVLNPFYSQCL
ncbi:hypothetical protein CVT24_008504 [Panaeolus cyanescens]|uniref:Glucanase n=1 Tax=Panaeolus cyanescens TaxID=181874 RepID=A0A409W4F1_9AGAR|nr:hypothetical protein CVT24_008504 [Panaeolus cyanescens]